MTATSNQSQVRGASRLLRGASSQAIGWALLIAAAGTMAHAQSAPAATAQAADQAADVITVTGIRGSIERSIHTKRISTSIVESVNAEEIGKLPDTSIAESIARLPGLTAQRLEGRDQVVSVRGFGPDFTTALLNGREQVTTGNNRGVEYDQYPSELISSVVVAKTPDAALIGQGMVGTVELNTMRPLDQSHRVLALQARGELDGKKSLNPDSPRAGYRFSGIYADKFANDTLGIVLGGALQSSPTQCECYSAWGFAQTGPNGTPPYALGGAKNYGESNVVNRLGLVGTIEYEPNENFHTTFDAFYSKFQEKNHLRGVETPLQWGGGVTESGITTAGDFNTVETFGNVHGVTRNDYDQRNSHTLSLGWNTRVKLTDKIHATLDLSWSRAHRADFLLESYLGTGYNKSGPADTITVTRQSNGVYRFAPTLNYADPSLFVLTDPQGWGGNNLGVPVIQAGYVNKPEFTDDLKAVRLDFEGDLSGGLFKSWRIGGNYSQRQKESNFTAAFLELPGGATTAAIPQAAVVGNGTGSPLGYIGFGPQLILNPLYLYDTLYVQHADARPVTLVNDYLVRERVELAYAMLNIDSHLSSIPVKGNVGFQVVHTNQFSTGKTATVATINGVQMPVVQNISGSDSYTKFLPSLNLTFEVAHNTLIRFGAARTLARPRLDQEEITSSVNSDLTQIANNDYLHGHSLFSASGGNIHLHPYISDGLDLTFERYFGSAGFFAVQGYYKRLTDFVNPNLSHVYDFAAFVPSLGLTAAQLAQLQATGTTLGLVSAPANSGRGHILGAEATLSVPFKMFTPALTGFGAEINGSITDSAVKYEPTDTQNLPLEGLSKYVAHATAYYERYGFQARVNVSYRSSFLGEVSGLSASRNFRGVKAETIVDAQIGYTFQEGRLKNLAILLQGKNLTDQPFVTYDRQDPRQVIDYQKYGPTFLFGASYKF